MMRGCNMGAVKEFYVNGLPRWLVKEWQEAEKEVEYDGAYELCSAEFEYERKDKP